MSELDHFDWPALTEKLDSQGWAVLPGLLTASASRDMAALFPLDAPFRKHVVMARHGYGSGDYKYFASPLPAEVATLRAALYRHVMPLADRWSQAMGFHRSLPRGRPDQAHAAAAAIRRRRL
jgi:hypothetical protein